MTSSIYVSQQKKETFGLDGCKANKILPLIQQVKDDTVSAYWHRISGNKKNTKPLTKLQKFETSSLFHLKAERYLYLKKGRNS